MAKAKKITKLEDLTPDERNANKHTERGMSVLESSLRNLGAGRSILASKEGVIIAGNATLETAASLGFPVRVVPTDGSELVVVQRTDLSANDARARELAIADNRAAELNLDWDGERILEAEEDGIDLKRAGFSDKELLKLAPPEEEIQAVKIHTCPRCHAEFNSDGDVLKMGETNASA